MLSWSHREADERDQPPRHEDDCEQDEHSEASSLAPPRPWPWFDCFGIPVRLTATHPRGDVVPRAEVLPDLVGRILELHADVSVVDQRRTATLSASESFVTTTARA